MILPTIKYSCLISGGITVWTSSSLAKEKIILPSLKCLLRFQGLQMTQKKEKEKTICRKSNFGMLKMGERGVVLRLWVVCSWLGLFLCSCHCLLGLLCLCGSKSVSIVYKPCNFREAIFFKVYYYLYTEFVYVFFIVISVPVGKKVCLGENGKL